MDIDPLPNRVAAMEIIAWAKNVRATGTNTFAAGLAKLRDSHVQASGIRLDG
jgi:hypothetical protein